MEASAKAGGAAAETERLRTFFVAYAQSFCAMEEDDDKSSLDSYLEPHPSVLLRVNGVVSQSPAFARAFGCHAGQPMAPEPRCPAW